MVRVRTPSIPQKLIEISFVTSLEKIILLTLIIIIINRHQDASRIVMANIPLYTLINKNGRILFLHYFPSYLLAGAIEMAKSSFIF